MFARYIKEYKHHATKFGPNTAIFLLVGTFYELYDIPSPEGEYQTSMKRVADILGIANVEKGEGRFAGFGVSQLHYRAAMLTRDNWTVVVIDQEKDDSGKVSGRSVARILSAGTHIEASQSETMYLGGIWLDPGAWTDNTSPPQAGATVIDLTTGIVKTFQTSTTGRRDAWTSDTLLHFFQVHPPKELVVWWKGGSIDMPTEQALRRVLGVPIAHIHIQPTQKQGALEKAIVREDLLRRCFNPKSLLPLKTVLGLDEYVERSTAALLSFIEDHHPSAMEHLHLPQQWSPIDSVYLGNHALTQLNMITTKEDDSVLSIFMKATTSLGSRAMRQRLLYPIADANKLRKLYREVEWAGTNGGIVQHLRHIKDLARLHRRIALASVSAADVLDLDQSYQSSRRLVEALQSGPLAMSEMVATGFESMLEEFKGSFDIEKARRAGENSFCMTAVAGPKTAAVEVKLSAAYAEMESILRQLNELMGVPGGFRMELKDVSVVVVGGKAIMRTAAAWTADNWTGVLKGSKVNAKKASSSLEVPALNTLYGKILHLREELITCIKEELPAICDRLLNHTATWDALESWIAQADVSNTIARVSAERGYCRPEIMDASVASIEAEGLRHPLIESQQTRLEYVKHDVRLGLDKEQGWLVYGMNASGKSSLMKAVGIAVLLAQCGCYVPATRLRFCPFRSLFTRILSTDNLWAGLSSFAVEMMELAEALRRADTWSLVLGDEVCSGTESMSAMSLVGGALQWLEKHGSRFIFATHLHGLPTTALMATKVWHLRVRHDVATDRLLYDRTLHPGPGSSLYGLEVARAMGIPMEVLETAHEIRRSLTGEVNAATGTSSSWNAAVQRRVCEVCSASIVRDLEVHHIQPRSSATAGRLADGSKMNDMRNLVVVCQACHDKHHAGLLNIGPVKQTSEGPIRDVAELQQFVHRPQRLAGLTEEEIATIQAELRAHPTLPVSRMLFELEDRHGICITAQRLRAIRGGL